MRNRDYVLISLCFSLALLAPNLFDDTMVPWPVDFNQDDDVSLPDDSLGAALGNFLLPLLLA